MTQAVATQVMLLTLLMVFRVDMVFSSKKLKIDPIAFNGVTSKLTNAINKVLLVILKQNKLS